MQNMGKNFRKDCEPVNCTDDHDCFFGKLNDDKNDEKRQTQISSVQFKFLFTRTLSKQSERGASFSTKRH